jgi:hypothetical protein
MSISEPVDIMHAVQRHTGLSGRARIYRRLPLMGAHRMRAGTQEVISVCH